jgi:transcriptional regulator GlxA family with amidase domain
MNASEVSRSNKIRVQLLVFDGFEEMDAIGLYEPLRLAGLNVDLVSVREQDVVTAAYGLRMIPQGPIKLDNKPSLLCVPGGGWLRRAPQGAWTEAEKGDVLPVLREFHKAGVTLAAVCTGVLLLGRAGCLQNRNATTNHQAVDELRAMGARVTDARVVDDGDIVTAAGITSSLDLGLWLIERFCGVEKALAVSRQLEFERRGSVWRKQAS